MSFGQALRNIFLVLCLLGTLFGRASWTLACGMPLEAHIPAEQAMIVFGQGREEIIVSLHLQSEVSGAAVIFPVPAVPQIDALTDGSLFQYLAEVTRPEIRLHEELVWDTSPRAGSGAPEGVNLLGREIIGGYDVAKLDATDVTALQAWLDENGYATPSGAAPILQSYVDDGWKFVAIKLAPDHNANGALNPLRIAFDSQQIIYPMRLGALSSQSLDVLLYVVADHRVDIAQLETQYAGPVAKLDRPPPAELAALFRAPYLTKLRMYHINPTTLSSDFIAQNASNDEPFRMVETRTVYVNVWDRLAIPIVGLIAVLVSSSIALGVAFGLRRRIDQIAGPDPEKEDD